MKKQIMIHKQCISLYSQSLAITILFIFLNFTLAHAQDSMPVVNFKNRQFIEDIPYGRAFIIQTPRTFDGKYSNICSVSIRKKGQANPIYSTYDWIKSSDNKTNNFNLSITSPLRFNQVYEFEFKYLLEEAFSPSETIVKEILFRTQNEYKNKGSIAARDVENILHEIKIKITEKKSFTNIKFNTENELIIDPDQLTMFKFPFNTPKGRITSDDFAQLAQKHFRLQEENKLIEEKKINIRRSQDQYSEILDSIEVCNEKKASICNKIQNFIETYKTSNISAYDFQRLEKDTCSKNYLNEIRRIRNDYIEISKRTNSINNIKNFITQTESRIGSLTEISKAGIRLVGILDIVDTIQITSIAQLKKVRIGTAFGGSIALLNHFTSEGPKNESPFGYFALKFYLQPVDRGLRKPYIGDKPFLNRSSIFVGLKAVGSFEYEGSALLNIFGTKPVIGYSYDFHRNFSIDIGTVLFRQKSVYPLIENKSGIRAAFTIGISFDPDLINQFRSLINDEKYKIQ